MKYSYSRAPVYALGVNEKTWKILKTWDLEALNVKRVLVQPDLYTLEFENEDQRSSFEMCMLMNQIQVEDFELAEYSQLV